MSSDTTVPVLNVPASTTSDVPPTPSTQLASNQATIQALQIRNLVLQIVQTVKNSKTELTAENLPVIVFNIMVEVDNVATSLKTLTSADKKQLVVSTVDALFSSQFEANPALEVLVNKGLNGIIEVIIAVSKNKTFNKDVSVVKKFFGCK